MAYETLLYEAADQIATITLNRPAKMNSFTPQMGVEIAESMMEAEADPGVRVIIMTGAGDRAFCAGADIGGFAKDVNTREGGGRGEFSGRRTVALPPLPTLMRNLSKPTIAAINGYALGVGMTIPILFDVRIASENAKMGVIFGRVGVMAELGSTYLLPRMIGLARASEMMLTGKQYTAAECLQMGLISQVTPAGKVMDGARDSRTRCSNARRPRRRSPSMRFIRRSMERWRRRCSSRCSRWKSVTSAPSTRNT